MVSLDYQLSSDCVVLDDIKIYHHDILLQWYRKY